MIQPAKPDLVTVNIDGKEIAVPKGTNVIEAARLVNESGSQESGVRSQERTRAARTFEDLIVWQKAHAWVLAIYRFSEGFPQKEIYALTSQFRRAAISVPANIAEGFKKAGAADKRRFMNIAQGSLEECRYYLILARDLRYGDSGPLMLQLEEVSRLLNAYSRAIEVSSS
jgi:four helix bundle protein